METEKILSGLVRIGTVTAVNKDDRLVQVKFQDLGFTSDWLPVLINRDVIPNYEYDDTQWTEYDTACREPRVGDKEYADHKHKLIIKPWMPKVNDMVLAIYLPVFNADGFVIGGIKPWR